MQKKGLLTLIEKLSGFQKLFICLVFGVAGYVLFPYESLGAVARIMMSWDVFSAVMIFLSWVTFFRIKAQQIREQAKVQDESRVVIFILVLIATLAGLIAVIILIVSKNGSEQYQHVKMIIAVLGMLLSWILIHTTFTLRYAHLFYGNQEEDPATHAGGLNFPGEKKPDYLDFAYFSFNVGMTFQVSDVSVTTMKLRRLVLLHSLISFLFATVMIALTVNVVSA